jgi:hypothetical protein
MSSSSSSLSPLAQHVAQFADEDGNLTKKSIKCPHFLVRTANDQGELYCPFSPTLELKTQAIRALATTAPGLLKCTNPAASGIWNSKGEFDELVFEELFAYHGTDVQVLGSKVRAITRQGFNDFLEANWKLKRGSPHAAVACRVLGYVPVSWQRITSGSLDELFSVFSDAKDEDGVPVITKRTLREFYTNPAGALRSRMTYE